MKRSMYVESRWCDKCVGVHWMEVEMIRCGTEERLTCHGAELYPADNEKSIVKSKGRGYQIIRRTKLYTNLPVVLAPMPERKPIEVDF